MRDPAKLKTGLSGVQIPAAAFLLCYQPLCLFCRIHYFPIGCYILARVLIIPLTRPYVIDYLNIWASNLRESFSKVGMSVEVLIWPDVLKPPMDCFVWSRMQYLSPCLLKWLYNYVSKIFEDYIIGIGYLDGFEHGLNFVFGEASPGLRTAIVYTKRLDPRFYGNRYDFNLYIQRVSKEVIHELGHLLDLGHCNNKECVMRFSNSVYEVDEKSMFFCRNCSAKLMKKLI